KRKQAQLLIAFTILAWATQTLMHQWGFGQEVLPVTDVAANPAAKESFVPGSSVSTPAGTLELRQDVMISGSDVKLKQLCRWEESDSAVFNPIGDLNLIHLTDHSSFHMVTVDDVREMLHNAGVNIAMINFTGA